MRDRLTTRLLRQQVSLLHYGEECSWLKENGPATHQASHELHIGQNVLSLELRAPSQRMDAIRFQIVSDLAAETWLNASRRWTQRHEIIFELPRTTTRTAETSNTSEPDRQYAPSDAVLT